MRILVLGSNGQLGMCLQDQISKNNLNAIYASRSEIDITNLKLVEEKILQIRPDVIINAAAYTSVDLAENEKHIANLTNYLAVENIARLCKKLDSWLIHISTDYVFDGSSNTPYKENDPTNPACVYGSTKLKGEKSIQLIDCKYLIIRTGWVFSEYGKNFLKSMLMMSDKQQKINIVSDQYGCPTYAQDLAKTIVVILEQLEKKDDIKGIYHYSGDIACSWYEFAEEIFKRLQIYRKPETFKLSPISTIDYKTLAKRPQFSVLDNTYVINKFNVASSDWKKGISDVLSILLSK